MLLRVLYCYYYRVGKIIYTEKTDLSCWQKSRYHLRCIIFSSHQSNKLSCWNDKLQCYFDRKMWRCISHKHICVQMVNWWYRAGQDSTVLSFLPHCPSTTENEEIKPGESYSLWLQWNFIFGWTTAHLIEQGSAQLFSSFRVRVGCG